MELDIQRWLYLWGHGYWFIFFRIDHHPLIFCNSIFCLKRPHDSNIKRLYVMHAVRWRGDKEYFAKMRKKLNRKYTSYGCSLPFHWQHWQISLLVGFENNLCCILLCATVLNTLLSLQLISFFTDHISTRCNVIHKRSATLLPFKCAPPFSFSHSPHITR